MISVINFDTLGWSTPRIAKDDIPGEFALKLIAKVWEEYSKFTALELSAMTHQRGTPWYETFMPMKDNPIKNTDIPEDLIKRKFRELAK